ncbi:hypothetical protein BC826DRAFT_142159 [Russula brevipes]|nr:hypothetical protein BC826DRAFT_142159 [Russula brevipes]
MACLSCVEEWRGRWERIRPGVVTVVERQGRLVAVSNSANSPRSEAFALSNYESMILMAHLKHLSLIEELLRFPNLFTDQNETHQRRRHRPNSNYSDIQTARRVISHCPFFSEAPVFKCCFRIFAAAAEDGQALAVRRDPTSLPRVTERPRTEGR